VQIAVYVGKNEKNVFNNAFVRTLFNKFVKMIPDHAYKNSPTLILNEVRDFPAFASSSSILGYSSNAVFILCTCGAPQNTGALGRRGAGINPALTGVRVRP